MVCPHSAGVLILLMSGAALRPVGFIQSSNLWCLLRVLPRFTITRYAGTFQTYASIQFYGYPLHDPLPGGSPRWARLASALALSPWLHANPNYTMVTPRCNILINQ